MGKERLDALLDAMTRGVPPPPEKAGDHAQTLKARPAIKLATDFLRSARPSAAVALLLPSRGGWTGGPGRRGIGALSCALSSVWLGDWQNDSVSRNIKSGTLRRFMRYSNSARPRGILPEAEQLACTCPRAAAERGPELPSP